MTIIGTIGFFMFFGIKMPPQSTRVEPQEDGNGIKEVAKSVWSILKVRL